MSKLIELNNLNADNFIELLTDSNIMVYENIQGSKIFIEWDGENFNIRTKTYTNNPINKIDLALQKYYNKLFTFLEDMDERVKNLLPKNTHFCCQYFPDEQPAHIRYDKIPSNNLILTSIVKNNCFTFNYEEIYEFARLLDITPQPLIFVGKLTPKQIELIKYFLYTKKEDLELIFGYDDNFASFFYKILNPVSKNSTLMNDNKFQSMLDKLIIKIEDNDEISLAILNPLYSKTEDKNNNYSETYSIILLDFLEFLQSIDFENKYIKGSLSDEIYIEILSDIFNRYVEDKNWRIKNFEFIIPPFFNEDKFKVNKDFIINKQTLYLIESSEKLEFIFKVILQSFRVKKTNPIGLFNKNTLSLFNDYVDIINGMIDKALRIESEEELMKHNLLDFGSFFKIKYPQSDADGKVYPDLFKKIDRENDITDKKKKPKS